MNFITYLYNRIKNYFHPLDTSEPVYEEVKIKHPTSMKDIAIAEHNKHNGLHRKEYDRTHFTLDDKKHIYTANLLRIANNKKENAAYITQPMLVKRLNSHLGFNKSQSSYIRIWTDSSYA